MANPRRAILSFDDGPQPSSALDSILTTLKDKAIKAEFYCQGNEVSQAPNDAKKIVTQGHIIQNHSWSHPNLAKLSEADVRSQLQKTQDIIKSATNKTPTKVRPPYGAGGFPNNIDPELAKVASDLNLTIIVWDIDTEDWKSPQGLGATKIAEVKKQLARQKSKTLFNVLMHVLPGTARDLPGFIDFLAGEGFQFATPTY